ncbi:hypothetical protein D9M68_856280 [compost metagenome]
MSPPSASASCCAGRARSSNTFAKPKPWMRPKAKARRQRLSENQPSRLLSAARITESAITDSMMATGGLIQPRMDATSVMECATVKAVTTASTSMNEMRKRSTALQLVTRWRVCTSGASTSRLSRKRMWSMPIQMCQMPSTT